MNPTLRRDADAIIRSSLNAVLPDEAVRRALNAFAPRGGRVLLVAAGKAAWQMAHAAVEALGRVDGGVVVTKYGHVKGEIPGVTCCEAGHPVPDENSFAATEKALTLVQGLTAEDTVLFLLSGDEQLVAKLMRQLTEDGAYEVPEELKEKIQSLFWAGCCGDDETKRTIGKVWQEHHYLCDTHTAVAWNVAQQYKAANPAHAPVVVLSTASPYKFPAAVLGAQVIEKHFTLDKSLPGPDQKASLDPAEFAAMVLAVRHAEAALGDGHKHLTESEAPNKAIARKSIVAARQIKAGEVFTEENLTTKRPGDGISPMRWHEILGQTAKRDFAEDEKIEL